PHVPYSTLFRSSAPALAPRRADPLGRRGGVRLEDLHLRPRAGGCTPDEARPWAHPSQMVVAERLERHWRHLPHEGMALQPPPRAALEPRGDGGGGSQGGPPGAHPVRPGGPVRGAGWAGVRGDHSYAHGRYEPVRSRVERASGPSLGCGTSEG